MHSLLHLRILVGREVVQHDHLPRPERRHQDLFDEGAKDRPVRKRRDCHQGTEPLERDRPQEREPLVAPSRRARERSLASRSARKEAAHARGDAALVQEDQVFGSEATNRLLEGYALGGDLRLGVLAGA